MAGGKPHAAMGDVAVGIVGASVAGLALARALLRHGLEATVYDPGPAGDPAPTTLGSRSLEALARWGALDAVKAAGIPLRRSRIAYEGATLGFLPTSEIPTRHPYLLSLTRQALRSALQSPTQGARVVGLRAEEGGLRVLLDDGAVRRHRFLAVAAGSLRRLLEVPLEDAPPDLPRWHGTGDPMAPDEFDLFLGPSGMARSYPGTGRVAAEGWIPRGGRRPPTLDELRQELRLPEAWHLEPEPPLEETGMAQALRVGPVFFLGGAARRLPEGAWRRSDPDVAEADNLAWKLAAVLAGAPPDLLDGYAVERRVRLPGPGLLPRVCAPRTIGLLGGFLRAAFVRRALGEAASGLSGRYPPSPWCVQEGVRSDPPAGARLPEVRFEDDGRPWLLDTLSAGPVILRFPERGVVQVGMARHLDPHGSVARALGARPGTVVVARPDGVIGYRAFPENPQRTAAWLARVQ